MRFTVDCSSNLVGKSCLEMLYCCVLMRTVTVCHAIPLTAKSNLGLPAYPYPLVLD